MKKLPVVHLSFLDHYETDGTDVKVIRCDAFGVLFNEDSVAYYITPWIAEGQLDHDAKVFSILKGKTTKVRRIGFVNIKEITSNG